MKKKIFVVCLLTVSLLFLSALVFAGGQKDAGKVEITWFWTLYEGVTEDFRAELEDAFNAANPTIDIDIVPVDWEQQHDKLTTALAGGQPPTIATIATRWLLEFMTLDAVVEVDQYVGKATLDDILPGTMEAKINGKLMGLPIAAGARILAYNPELTTTVPTTMEELREAAKKVTQGSDAYGLILPGKKHAELTDFAYYLLAAGGDMFGTMPDGSYGKCIVNSPAGVKALSFMVQLANEDKIVQKGYRAMDRKAAQPVFYAGKAGYVLIGAWVESAAKEGGATFQAKYAQIPGFKGQPSTPLVITDSIGFFKDAGEEQLQAAGKFIDFYYQPEWKGRWDEQVGFPPVTKSAAVLPAFQTPLYEAVGKAAINAKGWPLVDGWAEYSDIIWDANEKAFLGKLSPQEALDEAAAKIDELRGM